MTRIKKSITREKPKSRTVKTCDICGLAKVQLPDGENIRQVRSGFDREITYILHVTEYDDKLTITANLEDEWTEEFDTIIDAKDRLDELKKESKGKENHYCFHSETHIETEWELDLDACTNCRNVMFGAIDATKLRATNP